MNRLWLSLSLFALPSSAHACLNDRDSDSLATQAAKFPDTLRVITGRFERNPPLFYQMRIERESAQLKKTPRNFGLYDDIGVAFDKLHRDDEALRVMAQKRALLPPFDAKNSATKEAWYRYYANAGTFHAHHYLGEKSGDLSEMKTARGMIKRAIEIKPNAHFGREKYQLMTMDWIVATKTKKTEFGLSDWIYESREHNPRQAIEGLSGLIVLGAAWESVDVFDALGYSLKNKESVTLSQLALLRTQELLKHGRKSLAPDPVDSTSIDWQLMDSNYDNYEGAIREENQKTLAQLFPKLRAEAETWNSQRQNYMMTRLEKGDHPDTNPKFWSAWKPAAPPSLDVNWVNQKQQKLDAANWRNRITDILEVLLLPGACVLIWLLHRLFSRMAKLA